MEPGKDETIQSMLEAKQAFNAADTDMETYQAVFDALKKERVDGFSMRFTVNIIRAIEARQDRKFFYITYGLFAFVLLAGTGFMLFFLLPFLFTLFSDTLSSYKWIVLFVLFVIITIQLLDKKIKTKMN